MGSPECMVCHEGKTVLDGWGIKNNYAEKGSTTNQAITCASGKPTSAMVGTAVNSSVDANTIRNRCNDRHNGRRYFYRWFVGRIRSTSDDKRNTVTQS